MKRLYRSRSNKMIAGVCGGIAEYFNVDPVLIRIIAVFLFFTGGSALIAYIIGMIVIPPQPIEELSAAKGKAVAKTEAPTGGSSQDTTSVGALIVGVLLIIMGVIFTMRHIPIFSQYYWWFWHHGWDFFWPALLIVLGLILIIRGKRK